MKTIYVKDFSEFPGPRYRSLGPDSGEEFRESVLIPEIRAHGLDNIRFDLDGTYGYGSSFLEEAFGGLVRADEISENQTLTLVNHLVSDEDPSLIEEIRSYLADAVKEAKK